MTSWSALKFTVGSELYPYVTKRCTQSNGNNIKGYCYEIYWFGKISLLNNKRPVAYVYRKGSFPLYFIEFYCEPRGQTDFRCNESVTSKWHPNNEFAWPSCNLLMVCLLWVMNLKFISIAEFYFYHMWAAMNNQSSPGFV